MITNEIEENLIQILPKLHEFTIDCFKRKIISSANTDLTNIRDYFMYEIINCSDKENAKILIEKYIIYCEFFENKYSEYSEFYEAFFFTLINILCLKYEIKMMNEEKISYPEFQDSFKETVERYKTK